MKNTLRRLIEKWVSDTHGDQDGLDMWISETLVDSMTEAAWNVLEESRKTQEWLKREGMLNG